MIDALVQLYPGKLPAMMLGCQKNGFRVICGLVKDWNNWQIDDQSQFEDAPQLMIYLYLQYVDMLLVFLSSFCLIEICWRRFEVSKLADHSCPKQTPQ